jgi:hypothetical protein
MYGKDLSTKKTTYVWERERKVRRALPQIYLNTRYILYTDMSLVLFFPLCPKLYTLYAGYYKCL